MTTDSNETQARDIQPAPLELWAPQEVCDALGWNRTQLARARGKDFPKPVALVAGGSIAVWFAQDVRDWKLAQDPSRDPEWRRAEALRVYRRTGVVAKAAAAVEAKPDTIRKWLRDAGESLPSERNETNG